MNLSKSICPSTCNRSQRGVALVVTLILLSVITFLAVAFLFLARREKGASSQGVAQLTAKRMNETGTERAIAETVSHITATRNPFNYELRVSTNYVNTLGFASGVGSLTNVNFFYPNGNPVWQNPNDFETLVGNLYYSPRPPVFITTNKGFPADFRYYWDLNRNGLYDTNGLWAVIGFNPGNPPFYYDTNGNQVANYDPANSLKYFFKGDPEFVGILQHPDRPHSSSNLFVGRFAWALVPSGKTMDVNYIHNQSRQANQAVVSAPEGFSRNMGVGTWELNLGAFLSDLNTNYWGDYVYQIANPNQPAGGYAMLDAWRMLQYRYDAANGIGTRAISQVLPAGAGGLRTDLIDDFGSGFPLFTNVAPPAFSPDNGPDRTVGPWHWPGDDNPNHLFTTQDFFDANKIRNLQPLIGGDRGFGYRLQSSGLGISSYDRYTYYRMLEQLGTDSAPEPTGKMHLNYVNVDAAGKTVVDAQTNFVPWQALQFFTNALDRILAATYDNADTNVVLFNVHAPLSFTNIPVWVSNRFVYTAGLHR
ncbi:MAG: hypothetical protein RLY20_1744, partial [Verrucomicrobiota bacterium]